jgi:hypothetical protein
VIPENRRLTVREVSEEAGICKKFVPHNFDLETEDVSCCRYICAEFADRYIKRKPCLSQEWFGLSNADENVLKNVTIGYKTWVYGYDTETKEQSSQWEGKSSPRPKKHVRVAQI